MIHYKQYKRDARILSIDMKPGNDNTKSAYVLLINAKAAQLKPFNPLNP